VHYPPGAFGQNNLDIAQRIVEHVRGQVPVGARVTEFYAGVGAIGLSVLSRASHVRMNEVSPPSLQGLALGIDALQPAERERIDVIAGPAGTMAIAALDTDVVIADPPRKGLDRELVEQLIAAPPERFVYVSCGLESLLADTERLTTSGAMRLSGLRAFNLMPFTQHIETVAGFERA
jgi:tRNA/tmRNA/rRNA uracil-C5-methylase (TrmA/RlmC/RlmD family)